MPSSWSCSGDGRKHTACRDLKLVFNTNKIKSQNGVAVETDGLFIANCITNTEPYSAAVIKAINALVTVRYKMLQFDCRENELALQGKCSIEARYADIVQHRCIYYAIDQQGSLRFG